MTEKLVIADPDTIATILRQAAKLRATPEDVVLRAIQAFETMLPSLAQPSASDAAEPADFIGRALARAASARAALPPEASADQGEPYDDPNLR